MVETKPHHPHPSGDLRLNNELKTYVFDFLKGRGCEEDEVSFKALPGDGSKRLFWRVGSPTQGQKFIVMANSPVNRDAQKENIAYIKIGNHLKSKGVPVPRIHRFNPEQGWVIMEDLGKKSLQEVVRESGNPLPIYQKVVKELLHLQLRGAEKFNVKWCCQTPVYDRIVMRRDESGYFRDAFLGTYMGFPKEWPELEVSFRHLASIASQAKNSFFLYRDFQSRNIIVENGRIGLVDWQGGRLGPLGYDLASLLIDPYTALSPSLQKEIYQFYLSLLADRKPALEEDVEKYYPYLSMQRNLQILGAFAFLTKIRGKTYFEGYIPTALKSLSLLLNEVRDPELGPLKDIAMKLLSKFDVTVKSPSVDFLLTKNEKRGFRFPYKSTG